MFKIRAATLFFNDNWYWNSDHSFTKLKCRQKQILAQNIVRWRGLTFIAKNAISTFINMIMIKILAINVIVWSELCADMFYGAVSQRSNVANGPPVYINFYIKMSFNPRYIHAFCHQNIICNIWTPLMWFWF